MDRDTIVNFIKAISITDLPLTDMLNHIASPDDLYKKDPKRSKINVIDLLDSKQYWDRELLKKEWITGRKTFLTMSTNYSLTGPFKT